MWTSGRMSGTAMSVAHTKAKSAYFSLFFFLFKLQSIHCAVTTFNFLFFFFLFCKNKKKSCWQKWQWFMALWDMCAHHCIQYYLIGSDIYFQSHLGLCKGRCLLNAFRGGQRNCHWGRRMGQKPLGCHRAWRERTVVKAKRQRALVPCA